LGAGGLNERNDRKTVQPTKERRNSKKKKKKPKKT